MKSTKYFLFSIFALFTWCQSMACGGGSWNYYKPGHYLMYRVYDIKQNEKSATDDKTANCKEWQKLTSTSIPLEDIHQVVYKMKLEEIEKIHHDLPQKHSNKFVEWIILNDQRILDFLLLAKTNEYVRQKYNSRWYYPSMKIGARMSLEDIAKEALSNAKGKLADRYLLQAMRALFSLRRYKECVNLWRTKASILPESNATRKLMESYAVGAKFRLGKTYEAINYYAGVGDIESLLFCAQQKSKEKFTTMDALITVCEYCPNSQYIPEALQNIMTPIELITYGYSSWSTNIKLSKLSELSVKLAKDSKTANPAMWYYTAAFIANLKGQVSEASRLLQLAENIQTDQFTSESIAVLRFHLDAKTRPIDKEYETWLLERIKWIDSKIKSNLNTQIIAETQEFTKLEFNISYYYWNDMMRRIILADVCPRMLKAGKTTRALQLANMADNLLLNITHKGSTKYKYSTIVNQTDYRKDFFCMADSLTPEKVIEYANTIKNPQSEFDRYLNSSGYTNLDYIYDIIGSLYLRNMNYGEAENYFGKVSSNYYNLHDNIYIDYEPFSLKPKVHFDDKDFKYAFAREMHSLEQGIKATTDNDRRAKMMFKFAVGIKNSFELCWGLTRFHKTTEEYNCRYWGNDKYCQAAKKKYTALVKEACKIASDEVAAGFQYEMCNFKTIANKYPNTSKGKLVKGKCDNLIDYNALNK